MAVHGPVADVAYIGFVLGHGGDALQMLDLAHGIRDRGARVRLIVPDLNRIALVGDPLSTLVPYRHMQEEIPAVTAQGCRSSTSRGCQCGS